MSLFIGIDSSTTATKALIIDEQGQVRAVGITTYPYETPKPLWSEQNPQLWADATFASIRKALAVGDIDPADIAGIGLTGQMHGLVLLDESGQVLRPAILWNDQRTGPQCDEIRRRVGKERLIQITGNDALTGFTASKILWVQQEEPEVWARARHILLPKDYVRYRLTGELAMDKAGGSGTQLFDLARRDWSDEMLAALDIPASMLPTTVEGPGVTGRVSEEAAAATGQAELVACADPKPEAASNAVKFTGYQEAYDSAEELLEKAEVEAVIVATIHDQLQPMAMAAIQAGKHVLVEKPMARNAADGQALVDAAKKAKRNLMVGYSLRFSPSASA
jgi:xylulokinase